MDFKGSKTEKNLLAAFAGESQSKTKYEYYASITSGVKCTKNSPLAPVKKASTNWHFCLKALRKLKIGMKHGLTHCAEIWKRALYFHVRKKPFGCAETADTCMSAKMHRLFARPAGTGRRILKSCVRITDFRALFLQKLFTACNHGLNTSGFRFGGMCLPRLCRTQVAFHQAVH